MAHFSPKVKNNFNLQCNKIIYFSLSYDDKSLLGSFSIKLDVHSTNLIVPQKIYNAILNSFNGKFYGECDQFKNQPNFEFQIYNKVYSIPITEYFRPSFDDPSTCYLNIDQSRPDAQDQVQLDRAFLKNYCLLFDYKNMLMGLGKAF